MYLQLCKIAEKNRTYDLREKEHRDTGTQIYTELNLELLFRLTTTDSQSPVTSSPVTEITTYQRHTMPISSATLPP